MTKRAPSCLAQALWRKCGLGAELVEPACPGAEICTFGNPERDAVQAGLALVEELTGVSVVVVQSDRYGSDRLVELEASQAVDALPEQVRPLTTEYPFPSPRPGCPMDAGCNGPRRCCRHAGAAVPATGGR